MAKGSRLLKLGAGVVGRAIAAATPLDDACMSVLFDRSISLGNLLLRNTPGVCGARAALVLTQKKFVTPGGKSIVPDTYIEDELGRQYIYEIQRKSSGAQKERMSYELSLLDPRSLPKGK